MSDSLNNKELVAFGHQFAKTMSSDTPIIEMAKIVSRLAERLDCTTAALREMTKQRDALAAEKATPGKWRRASTRFNGITAQSAYPLCGKEDILANAAEKRDAEFIAAANPATVLALLDELEVKGKQIAGLEALTAPAVPVIPNGYTLVPVEPTAEMLAEICLVDGWTERALQARYEAMLAAATQQEKN